MDDFYKEHRKDINKIIGAFSFVLVGFGVWYVCGSHTGLEIIKNKNKAKSSSLEQFVDTTKNSKTLHDSDKLYVPNSWYDANDSYERYHLFRAMSARFRQCYKSQ